MSSARRNGKITSVIYHDDATIEGKGSYCLEAALAMALEASSPSGGETEEEEKTCIETEKAPAADFDPILEASEKSYLAFSSTAEDGDSRSKPSYFEPVPDDVLCRILTYAGSSRGKCCKRWEKAKTLVLRARHVDALVQKTKLPEPLCRALERELFLATQERIASREYQNMLRKLLFHLKDPGDMRAASSNTRLREELLIG
ncbi:hypothetical protein Naga_100255g7 [Nannochloropsis gaditana]|uniref:F-box domain-containing protein n=1 Tax=Nannochloropsis gaditana TaxID=72520 RepID=W7TMN5_9STRA|nr:hypothetical protein Naga_100255g7 [Nannochloropsis gaditana]